MRVSMRLNVYERDVHVNKIREIKRQHQQPSRSTRPSVNQCGSESKRRRRRTTKLTTQQRQSR